MKPNILLDKYPNLPESLAVAIYTALWGAILAELFAYGKVHIKGLGWIELHKGDKTERYYVREAVAALTVIANNTISFHADKVLKKSILASANKSTKKRNCLK